MADGSEEEQKTDGSHTGDVGFREIADEKREKDGKPDSAVVTILAQGFIYPQAGGQQHDDKEENADPTAGKIFIQIPIMRRESDPVRQFGLIARIVPKAHKTDPEDGISVKIQKLPPYIGSSGKCHVPPQSRDNVLLNTDRLVEYPKDQDGRQGCHTEEVTPVAEEGQPGRANIGSAKDEADHGGYTVGQAQQIDGKQEESKMNPRLDARRFGGALFFTELKPIPEQDHAADQKQHTERVLLTGYPSHFSFAAMDAIEPTNGREVTNEHERQWKKQVGAPYKNCAQGLLWLRFGKNHQQNGNVPEFLKPPFKGNKGRVRPENTDQKKGIEEENRPVLGNNLRPIQGPPGKHGKGGKDQNEKYQSIDRAAFQGIRPASEPEPHGDRAGPDNCNPDRRDPNGR